MVLAARVHGPVFVGVIRRMEVQSHAATHASDDSNEEMLGWVVAEVRYVRVLRRLPRRTIGQRRVGVVTHVRSTARLTKIDRVRQDPTCRRRRLARIAE